MMTLYQVGVQATTETWQESVAWINRKVVSLERSECCLDMRARSSH